MRDREDECSLRDGVAHEFVIPVVGVGETSGFDCTPAKELLDDTPRTQI